jgi:2-haloacid dehalogenase
VADPAIIAPIDACVFDAYGTLFDVSAAAARHRAEIGDSWERFSALWRQKQVEYTWLRSLMGVHADFWQVTADALDYALVSTGLEASAPERRAGSLHARLMEVYRVLDAYADAAATLRALRDQGFRTAVLSNGAPSMLEAAVEKAGLGPLLDAVLSIEAIGIYKPHPSVYRLAVERLEVEAPRICFVTANGWDAAGAAQYGFRVAWINRLGHPPERLPAGPEIEIAALGELPGRVRRTRPAG